MQFNENIPLASYTTLGIGGPARWFADARNEDDIVAAVEFARSRALRLFVLGGGSNLLISDAGFDGLVLKIGLLGTSVREDSIVIAAAGEDWDQLVTYAVNRNLGGMECLAGIPGTVGGTPVQNVGAYGQEVSQTVLSVRALDLTQNKFVELTAEGCGFAYRRSVFNSTARGRYIVSQVVYRLKPNGMPNVSYADLHRQFQKQVTAPTLSEVAGAVRAIRQQKGMLLVPGDPDCRSAGSFFKNPVVSSVLYDNIATRTSSTVPSYPAGIQSVKIPAAWLVEQAGFLKGFSFGQAGISSRHALALINRGGASAAEVAALRDTIVAAVELKFGIKLEPEPVWVE